MNTVLFVFAIFFAVKMYKNRIQGLSLSANAKFTWHTNVIDNKGWAYWVCAMFVVLLATSAMSPAYSTYGSGINHQLGIITGVLMNVFSVGIFVLVLWFIIKRLLGRGGSIDPEDTSYGSAEWTPHHILETVGIASPINQTSGFLWTGSLNFNKKDGHIVVAAGSRSENRPPNNS